MDNSKEKPAKEAVDGARTAREKAKPWVELLTRLGYIADGVVYIVVGYLALQAALGSQSADVRREEALRRILAEPLGQVLLIVIAVGLLGYAAGHFLMATRSRAKEEREGTRALVNRGAHLVNGFVHGSLAVAAAELVFGFGGGEGRGPEDWTAIVMQQPLGRWAVGLAGTAVMGLAIYELHKAYTANFREVLRMHDMRQEEGRWITHAGRIGYTARGIVYGIISAFLIEAAWLYDPREAGGLGEALVALSAQSYGPWVLGAVAVGFMAFGIYVVFLGRYREFNL